jgi:hypothetical protein
MLCYDKLSKQVIPRNFLTKHQQKANESTFWVSEERTWRVKFKLNTSNGQISFNDGWKNFVMDNNLKPGDVCVFELTKSTGVSFQVVVFRATEQSSGPPKI